MKSKRPQTLRGETYIIESQNWPFRLYTVREVQLLLRLDGKTLMKIRRDLGIEPLQRRILLGKKAGQLGNRKFFTDRMVNIIIDHMFKDIEKEI
jgi:hypothetical protein